MGDSVHFVSQAEMDDQNLAFGPTNRGSTNGNSFGKAKHEVQKWVVVHQCLLYQPLGTCNYHHAM